MILKPFPFQIQLRDFFKKQSKTWNWFATPTVMHEQAEAFKTDLLKNVYRIDAAAEPQIYEVLNKAKEKLGIIIPVTIYQSQAYDGNNASIVFFDNEAHIILSGGILKLLTNDELLALLAHELSHILLYNTENREFEITNNIINAIANDNQSELFYHETARLYQLYTELYCDLGALKVCEDLHTVIGTLVKLHTGLDKVSAESYLKQADEILERTEKGAKGETHPEIFIRAKSLQMFQNEPATYYEKIGKLVIGKNNLQQLNLFSKTEIYNFTKQLVDIVLKPKWTQSEYCIALYRQYFTDFKANSSVMITQELKESIDNSEENLKDYFAYVMLDFALCDADLKEPFLGLILDLGEQLNLANNLKNCIKKELKLTDKQFKDNSLKYAAELNQILESEQEKTY